MGNYHTPVLLQEVLAHLKVIPGHKYIDATLGGGGHTQAILQAGGKVMGLDQDSDSIAYCQSLEAFKPALASGQLVLQLSNFIHLEELAHKHGWINSAGIILDLGVSSHQLETPSRGFSFQARA